MTTSTKTKTIRQAVIFKASPHEVYETLMDSRKHAQFTGSKASISRKVGGRISAYDGYINGENLELVPDKKIVQKWGCSGWPKGHYSTATFLLEKTKAGTRMKFTQTGVPVEFYNDISQGWRDHYWQPMRAVLDKKSF